MKQRAISIKSFSFVFVIVILFCIGFLFLTYRNSSKLQNTFITPSPVAPVYPLLHKLMTARLYEQNNSGQNGTVAVRVIKEQLLLNVNLEKEPADEAPQRSDLYTVSCKRPGVLKYHLQDVVDGA